MNASGHVSGVEIEVRRIVIAPELLSVVLCKSTRTFLLSYLYVK